MVTLALDALAAPLDRSLLHVFVAGPGYGEGIAVALPGSGWLLIDGCEVSGGRLPLLAMLDRWRLGTEQIDALCVTHPHEDHALGIRATLERLKPLRVGITTSPSQPELVYRSIDAAETAPDPLTRRGRRVVADAMAAIQRYVPNAYDLIPLVDGWALPLTTTLASAHVRAPDGIEVHNRLAGGVRGDPNELSAVIEIAFGATRVVLGSDLPTVDANGNELAHGWNAVIGRHPHLGAHHALKIPHHGSRAAFHQWLMTPGQGRPWWISPFSKGKRLPPTDPDGVPRLVGLNKQVGLTAIPRSRKAQPIHPPPGVVPLASLAALFLPGAPAGAGALSVTPPELEPLDPVWCAAFDDQGSMCGEWRGNRAFTVTS